MMRAIKTGPHKRIAVIFVEWGGVDYQNIKVPWTLIDGGEAAQKFADGLARKRLTAPPYTSISSALRPRIFRVQAPAPWHAPPRIDCKIGEKLWDEWLGYQD